MKLQAGSVLPETKGSVWEQQNDIRALNSSPTRTGALNSAECPLPLWPPGLYLSRDGWTDFLTLFFKIQTETKHPGGVQLHNGAFHILPEEEVTLQMTCRLSCV